MARLTFESLARVVRAVLATIHRSRSTAWAQQVAALCQGLVSWALRWAANHRQMVWAMDSGTSKVAGWNSTRGAPGMAGMKRNRVFRGFPVPFRI